MENVIINGSLEHTLHFESGFAIDDFNYGAGEIAKYMFCTYTGVFSIRLENGRTVYHKSENPDRFLNWLKRYKIPSIPRNNNLKRK